MRKLLRPYRRHNIVSVRSESKHATLNYLGGDIRSAMLAVATFTGTTVLYGYFFYIDYFPPLEWSSLLNLLLSLCFITGILLVSLSTAFLIPYLYIGLAVHSASKTLDTRHLLGQIIKWAAVASLSFVIFLGMLILGIELKWDPLVALLLYEAIIFLGALAWRTVKFRNTRAEGSPPQEAGSWRARLKSDAKWAGVAALVGGMQIFPLEFVNLIINRASAVKSDDWLVQVEIVLAFALLQAVFGGAALYFTLKRSSVKLRVGIPGAIMLCAPVVVLLIAQAPQMIPMRLADITKLGNFTAKRLTVSGSACKNFDPALGYQCGDGKDNAVHICNVHIMSRLGNETYLWIASTTIYAQGKYAHARIVLPSADIRQLEIDDSKHFMKLDKVREDLESNGADCEKSKPQQPIILQFERDSHKLSLESYAALAPVLKTARDASHQWKLELAGFAAANEQNSAWLAHRRAVEVELALQDELRTNSLPVAIHASGNAVASPVDCQSALTKADCERSVQKVIVTLTPVPIAQRKVTP